MQEDILGTRRAAMPTLIFVQCVRCGKATPRADAKIANANAYFDSNSEFEYLCKECQHAEDTGDNALPEDV